MIHLGAICAVFGMLGAGIFMTEHFVAGCILMVPNAIMLGLHLRRL